MSIKTDEHGTISISGEHVRLAQLLAILMGLRTEVATGIKMSRGRTMKQIAADWCGSDKRTKHGVLLDYALWYHEHIAEIGQPTQERIEQALPGAYPAKFRSGITRINKSNSERAFTP